jgi:5'-nucleotidase
VLLVLVTNDDGVFSEGLAALCLELEKQDGAEVFVVAPDRERSASGHAITMHQPLRVDEVNIETTHVRPAWAVSGTPADCTKLAVKALLPRPPDIVVSGVNRGPNLGTDVFYSGTVSAAIEAAMLGIPAIAVSVAAYENVDYTLAARFAANVARTVVERKLPADTILNINVPGLPPSEVAGVAITSLGKSRFNDRFEKRVDPRGRAYYWLTGELVTLDDGPDSDMGAISRNMISLTPVHLDLTSRDLIKTVCDWSISIPEMPAGGLGPCEIKE